MFHQEELFGCKFLCSLLLLFLTSSIHPRYVESSTQTITAANSTNSSLEIMIRASDTRITVSNLVLGPPASKSSSGSGSSSNLILSFDCSGGSPLQPGIVIEVINCTIGGRLAFMPSSSYPQPAANSTSSALSVSTPAAKGTAGCPSSLKVTFSGALINISGNQVGGRIEVFSLNASGPVLSLDVDLTEASKLIIFNNTGISCSLFKFYNAGVMVSPPVMSLRLFGSSLAYLARNRFYSIVLFFPRSGSTSTLLLQDRSGITIEDNYCAIALSWAWLPGSSATMSLQSGSTVSVIGNTVLGGGIKALYTYFDSQLTLSVSEESSIHFSGNKLVQGSNFQFATAKKGGNTAVQFSTGSSLFIDGNIIPDPAMYLALGYVSYLQGQLSIDFDGPGALYLLNNSVASSLYYYCGGSCGHDSIVVTKDSCFRFIEEPRIPGWPIPENSADCPPLPGSSSSMSSSSASSLLPSSSSTSSPSEGSGNKRRIPVVTIVAILLAALATALLLIIIVKLLIRLRRRRMAASDVEATGRHSEQPGGISTSINDVGSECDYNDDGNITVRSSLLTSSTSNKKVATDSTGSKRKSDYGAATTANEVTTTDLAFSFTKGKCIGQGAFGRVYLARNDTFGGLVAAKELLIDEGSGSKREREIAAEIEAMKRLEHPNMVKYMGFERSDDGHCYILMEYLPGGSLLSSLNTFGKLDPAVAAHYTRQALQGLRYLHSQGVVHRDLKAANMLLGANNVLKLSDLGASKPAEASVSFAGTPMWLAPEVIKGSKGDQLTPACDIWALGCTVMEMLTGRLPFAWLEVSPFTVMHMVGAGGERLENALLELQKILHAEDEADGETSGVEVGYQFIRACLEYDQYKRPSAAELLKHPFLKVVPTTVWKPSSVPSRAGSSKQLGGGRERKGGSSGVVGGGVRHEEANAFNVLQAEIEPLCFEFSHRIYSNSSAGEEMATERNGARRSRSSAEVAAAQASMTKGIHHPPDDEETGLASGFSPGATDSSSDPRSKGGGTADCFSLPSNAPQTDGDNSLS